MLLDFGCLIVWGDVYLRSDFCFDLTLFCLIFVNFWRFVAAVILFIMRVSWCLSGGVMRRARTGSRFDLTSFCLILLFYCCFIA